MTSRRTVLIAGAAGAAALAGGIGWWRAPPSAHEPPFTPDAAFPNPLRLPGGDGLYGIFDIGNHFTIVGKPVTEAIVPGKPVTLLAYEIEADGKRYRNPLLRMKTGGMVRAKFWNALEETSIIHWHGLIVDSNNDGHPHYAVGGGEIYEYDFPVPNRAATYWYHPHPHHLTGKQVYLGLGGVFIVEDDEELALQKALDLALGVTDIPLVLHDRRINEKGELVFAPTDDEKADGFLGEQVLVNWTPKPYLEATTRIYRFRVLNASNARVYKLAFKSGEHTLPHQLIGNDGGLLEAPREVRELFVSPAERIDVLLDLRAQPPGSAITLHSLAFDAMEHQGGPPAADTPTAAARPSAHAGHGAHASYGAGPPADQNAAAPVATAVAPAPAPVTRAVPALGVAMELMRIHVRRKVAFNRAVPEKLSRIMPIAANCGTARIITLDHVKMVWRINGHTYAHETTPITVKRGAVEVWEIKNVPASMPHPFHIHGFQFQVLERKHSPEQQKALAINDKGLAASDLGWKDTVLVWPGESVCIVIDFSHPFYGNQVYMIHCHNLEHEDQGMMLNLRIEG
ncbi:MAG: multicopper oxidase family protein [Betaproteobacteria bacterium]|nr:multicopper oxidase family protein [Betaproteobacteria bacterium]